jgi:NADPH2:quinone reductase
MKAIVYNEAGGPEVLRLVERSIPEPGRGEVRVRIHISGVNPTDWKVRSAPVGSLPFPEMVPNQDGAGVIDAVGPGVATSRLGERVWIWEASYARADGTAQELVVLPSHQAVSLPASASFALGASLGIPFLTAHRCLTVADSGPQRLGPGTLKGRTVLVTGGAGAVGNAAIQLARWSDATVIATISTDEKAVLAHAAGAQHVINYRSQDVARAARDVAPAGIDLIVEVAPAVNAAINASVLAPAGTIAIYANEGANELALSVGSMLTPNVRLQFVGVYTVPPSAKAAAVEDVSAAIASGFIRIGTDGGLPLHRYPLENAALAHAAVEGLIVGKVLIDVDSDGASSRRSLDPR